MSWRDRSKEEIHEFVVFTAETVSDAVNRGKESYPNDTFEGDPIDQAIQENIDQLFYLFYAKRRHEAMLKALSTREDRIVQG